MKKGASINASNATVLYQAHGSVGQRSDAAPSPLIPVMASLPDLFTKLMLSIRDLKYSNDAVLQRYHQWMVQLAAYAGDAFDDATWQYVAQYRSARGGELSLSLQSALRESEGLASPHSSDQYVRAIQTKVTDRLYVLQRCSADLSRAAEDVLCATWHATHHAERQKAMDAYMGKLSQFHTQCQTKFGLCHQSFVFFVVSIMGDVAELWHLAAQLEQDLAQSCRRGGSSTSEGDCASPLPLNLHRDDESPRVNASPATSRQTSSILSFVTASNPSAKLSKAETDLLARVTKVRESVEAHLHATQRSLALFATIADALQKLTYTNCSRAFAEGRHPVLPSAANAKPSGEDAFVGRELHEAVHQALTQFEISCGETRQNWFATSLDDRVGKTLSRSFRYNMGKKPKSGEALERPSSTMLTATDDTLNLSTNKCNVAKVSSGETQTSISPLKKTKKMSTIQVLEAEVRKNKSQKGCKALAAALCEEAWFTFAELNYEMYNVVLEHMSACVA